MSASRERKYRQGSGGRNRQEPVAGKQTAYWIGGIALIVLGIAAVVWNMGLIQARATALTVGGQGFTTPYVEYYYRSAYLNASYYAQYGLLDFDISTSAKKQVFDPETGETYHDYFMTQATDSLTRIAALCQEAQRSGFTLPAQAQQVREETLTALRTQARLEGASSVDSYLKARFGSTVNMKVYEGILDMELLASYYGQEYSESLSYTQGDLDTYYAENRDDLDYYDLSVFTFRAEVPAQTAADGTAVVLTEEETAAALESAKTEMERTAQAVQTALAAGEDAHTLEETYEAYSVIHDQETAGSALNLSYADWAKSAQRKPGDTTLAESDGGTTYTYYAVRYEGRRQDTNPSATVRHILVAAQTDADAPAPTDAQYDAAQTQAQAVLDQWKSGEATADSFAQLALEHSADVSSAQNGGLIREILPEDTYIPEFSAWALEPGRVHGDTGLVQNTGSEVKGWHIMFFEENGRPNWHVRVEKTLRDQDYLQWQENLLQSAQVTEGTGLSFIE